MPVGGTTAKQSRTNGEVRAAIVVAPAYTRWPVDTASTRGAIRQCSSCGATLEVDRTALSTTCTYCGSQLVDCIRGKVEVDRVAPFRIPRRAAEEKLQAHVAGRWWAPGPLRRLARTGSLRAQELRGAMVPFYAYTATVNARYRARIGVQWYRKETVQRKGKEETRLVQEIEWFDLRGTAVDQLEDHLVSASLGLDPDEARRLMPFDLGKALPFEPRLLAGWQAELPSRSRVEVDRSARRGIAELEQRRVRSKLLPGDRRKIQHFDADIEVHAVQLVLLPVWIAIFEHGGEAMRLLVHGQSGACFGRVPVSGRKVALVVSLLLAAVLVTLWLSLGGSRWM